jgi:hypothetical protein
MVTIYIMRKEGVEILAASKKASEVLRPILWDAGIRQWVSPHDGVIMDVAPSSS